MMWIMMMMMAMLMLLMMMSYSDGQNKAKPNRMTAEMSVASDKDVDHRTVNST